MGNEGPHAPRILTCPEWEARQPRHEPVRVGKPNKIIVHHTAGHGPRAQVQPWEGHSIEEAQARAYAHVLQDDMMERRGWNDSGHNFLVMRSGVIIQGRWGTVTALEHGKMVESAHCPGQNDQPGIEHEHLTGEQLTPAQAQASIHLMAWICLLTGIRPTELYGHSHYYPTACPSDLNASLPWLRLGAARLLTSWRPV